MSGGGTVLFSPPRVFPLFMRLPPEIRYQIWRESTPAHRFVPIKYQRDTCSYVPRICPPTILQVNQESRREGLTIYHELRLGPVPVQDCYVDLTRDVIYLRSDLPNRERHNREDALDASERNMDHRGRLASPPPPRQHSAALQPLTHPSPTVEDESSPLRHSKIILYDLLNSADGQAMLRALHVNQGTWFAMRRYYRYRRHRLTVHMERLVLVHERGTGPLSEDTQLKPIHYQRQDIAERRPPYYREDRIATLMRQSFRAECGSVNRIDRDNGLPAVLNFAVEAMSLNRSKIVIGLQGAQLAKPNE